MTDHPARIDRARSALESVEADALLVTSPTNVRYLTGFSGSNGQLLVTASSAIFMSDPRYEARASDLVRGAEVAIYQNRPTDVLVDRLRAAGIGRLGFESTDLTWDAHDRLDEKLGDVELVATKELVEELRRAKDPEELSSIREAVRVGDEACAWILERIAPGRIESDIALDLEVWMRNNGAERVSFEPIVGSGPLSAHIHHTPSQRALQDGDLVLLDFGCVVDGYCSDLTRTVSLGSASDDFHALYATVLEAQEAGIAATAAGAAGRDVDAAARTVIANAGHAERFGHGLGHGVGLDVHESPRLARTSEDELAAGDVVTIEPGVYIPGRGGIRIEDCVTVTDRGAEVLGSAPKEKLLEL